MRIDNLRRLDHEDQSFKLSGAALTLTRLIPRVLPSESIENNIPRTTLATWTCLIAEDMGKRPQVGLVSVLNDEPLVSLESFPCTKKAVLIKSGRQLYVDY